MRVLPVPPVVLVPKKTDKVQNDPERRKINKRDKAKNIRKSNKILDG